MVEYYNVEDDTRGIPDVPHRDALTLYIYHPALTEASEYRLKCYILNMKFTPPHTHVDNSIQMLEKNHLAKPIKLECGFNEKL